MQWHLAVVRASVAHWAASVGRLLILVACFGAHGVTVGASAEVERGTTWLQGQVLANGTLQAQASAGAQQLAADPVRGSEVLALLGGQPVSNQRFDLLGRRLAVALGRCLQKDLWIARQQAQ